jgi:hypothetical protein
MVAQNLGKRALPVTHIEHPALTCHDVNVIALLTSNRSPAATGSLQLRLGQALTGGSRFEMTRTQSMVG